MDTTWIKMLKAFGKEHKQGEQYEVDTEFATQLIETGYAEKAQDPTADLLTKLEKSFEKQQADTIEKITETINKSVKASIPAVAKSEDKGSLGEWLSCLGKMSNWYAQNKDQDGTKREKAFNMLNDKYKANYNQTTTTQGGFLVPVQYENELIYQSGFETAVFPNRVKPRAMSGKIDNFPTLDQTITPSGGNSAFIGGVTVAVVAEGTAPGSHTLAAYKQIQLTAKKLMATSQASTEVLENNNIGLEQRIKDDFSRAALSFLDYKAINGAGGSGDYTGVLNHAATITVERTTANRIKYADLANMYSKLTTGGLGSAFWLVNPNSFAEFLQVADAAGNAVWLPGSSAFAGPQLTFLGLPVVRHEGMPSKGSEGDVILFTGNAYHVGVNGALRVDVSDQFAFTSDLMTYRFTYRLDMIPALTAPILLQGGGSVSPFVQLSSVVAS